MAVCAGWCLGFCAFAETSGLQGTNRPPISVPSSARGLSIQLPDANFRDTPLREIINWIRMESVAADPAGVGVNLILKDDPDGRLGSTRLTIRMTRPTVQDLLRRLSTTVGLYVRVDAHAIVIERAQAVSAR